MDDGNQAQLEILQLGHVPVIGVNLALPIIGAAGAERYDAVVRVGGASAGADREVERVREHGGMVFASIAEVPRLEDGRGPG
jgi:hypothetical protein